MHSASPAPGADRGQVGIGTLIVFIAMVLVAAITAGVFFEVAGSLEAQTEETGGQSGRQVVDRIQVTNAFGTRLGGDEVGVVNLTVKRSVGAADVNLENVTVQWVGPSGTYDLVNASVSEPGADGRFGVAAFKDEDGSHPILNSPRDRMVLVFDLGQDDLVVDDATSLDTRTGSQSADSDAGQTYFGEQLPEGASVSVRITTRSGASTSVQLVVPATIGSGSSVEL